MPKPRVAVVDVQDRFLRWATRDEVHAERLPHRSVQVFVLDARGRLVVQKRHASKQTHPNTWDISCSGHVEESDYPVPSRPDENLDALYDAVAARELEEELGVRAPLTCLGKLGPEPGVHYEHFRLYLARSDGPFVLQPEEVAEVRWLDPAALDALFSDPQERVTPSLRWLVAWARADGALPER